MIQLSRDGKILFTLAESSILKEDDPRRRPLVFDLLYGHVCPHCGSVAQAMYKTGKHMKQLTRDFWQLPIKTGLGPSKFAVTAVRHAVTPKFHSFLLQAGGESAELIQEAYHFDRITTEFANRCPYRKGVFRPQGFDLKAYWFAALRILDNPNWHPLGPDAWSLVHSLLNGSDEERNQANLARLDERLKDRVKVAEDVTGLGPPLWLLSKGDWGQSTVQIALSLISN